MSEFQPVVIVIIGDGAPHVHAVAVIRFRPELEAGVLRKLVMDR